MYCVIQGYHHQQSPIEHMMTKNASAYGASEPDKFFISSTHGPSASGSSNAGSTSSVSGLRSHTGLLAPIPGPGSHPSGIPIQQQNHAKSGSIITGNPLRPPPSTASYHPTISASHVRCLLR